LPVHYHDRRRRRRCRRRRELGRYESFASALPSLCSERLASNQRPAQEVLVILVVEPTETNRIVKMLNTQLHLKWGTEIKIYFPVICTP
jgi:hypothetical protein